MAKNDLSDREIMDLTLRVEFEEFARDAEATFDGRFDEWHIRFLKFSPFHFFSREIRKDERGTAINAAFDYMRLIAEHRGVLNMCGVFVRGVEEIVVHEQKSDYAAIRLAHSAIADRWFYGVSSQISNGGGGFAPSISERKNSCSAPTRAGAEVLACETLCRRLEKDNDFARAARLKAEKYILDILGKSPQIPVPAMLARAGVAVQQSLF